MSKRQLLAMTWWNRPKFQKFDGIICDGSIRSGKTVSMSVGFVLWAMARFDGAVFAICGKTIESLRRNVIVQLPTWLEGIVTIKERRNENKLLVTVNSRTNSFYLFGGRDESSYTLIQGITLAGVLFDEVALMPRSFVEQALARCSVEGARFWFNCNPENPMHWFRQEWILNPEKHNALHLHFLMDDNPSLSEEVKARYQHTYSGVFYQRYVLGQWVMSEGVIYSMFDQTENVYRPDQRPADMVWSSTRIISCDYGTANPCRFLDIYDNGEVIRVDREYDWDSRRESLQKTDKEYADDLMAFMGEKWCTVIVDPSAASFIAELRSRGVYVIPANNDVPDGIRKTANLIQRRIILVCDRCVRLIDEMGTYMWDDKAAQRGDEKPIKQQDHSEDALRYFVNYLPEWRFE